MPAHETQKRSLPVQPRATPPWARPGVLRSKCSSFHSSSRSGDHIVYSRCLNGDCNGGFYLGLLTFDRAQQKWLDTVDADSKQYGGFYSTFSPDGALVLTSWSDG